MREYETTIIVQPEISDDGVGTLCERLDEILSKTEAVRLLFDDLGKRRLAYEISSFQKGRYVMLHFIDDGRVINDLERSLRLEDSVIRYLTVQVDDAVEDIEARKAWAVEEEKVRAQRAAERAAREAEEQARAEVEAAEAAQRAAEAAALAATAAEASDAASDAAPEAAAADDAPDAEAAPDEAAPDAEEAQAAEPEQAEAPAEESGDVEESKS